MSSFDALTFWCSDYLRKPVTFEINADFLEKVHYRLIDYVNEENHMCGPDWRITFSSPLQTPITFVMSSALLFEATRSKEVSCLIADSEVEGALIAYGEEVQDNLNFNRKND